MGPDWTLLFGAGSEFPSPFKGRTLTVLEVDDLNDAVSKFDGNVQTLGLGMRRRKMRRSLPVGRGKRGGPHREARANAYFCSSLGRR